jgi:hypothetical protein
MYKIEIKVNGSEVKLTEFPAKIIQNAIIGMMKSLHGVEEIEDAVIRIRKGNE